MLERFRTAYANPQAEVARALADGRRPILTLGFDAPRAHLIAAGFQPIRAEVAMLTATPRADAIMGEATMSRRGRQLLETFLDPAHPDVPLVITQADAEQPQIFAALRELARLGERVPRHVHFFDRLHMARAASHEYTAGRMAQLEQWLGSLGGKQGGLAEAQATLDRVAELVREIDGHRVAGRMTGTDFLEVVGASAMLTAAEFEQSGASLLAELADAQPVAGNRLVVSGSPHEGADLYRAIEAAGAVIVGEDHPWGLCFIDPERKPPRVETPSEVGARVAAVAQRSEADAVLHLCLEGDEAAPWDAARISEALPAGLPFTVIRSRLQPNARFIGEVEAFVRGEKAPEVPKKPASSAPKKPRAPDAGRSRKSLASVADFNSYQREWFADVRRQVSEGSPFAMCNANAPQEILRALDIPFVVNQWWASIVAAKQQSRRYQQLLRDHGFPADVEAYSAQGLAAVFEEDAENAPWGGLPDPEFVFAVASSDPSLKIFDLWGEEAEADSFVYERTVDPRPDLYCDWWDRVPDDWEDSLESERIDLMTAELKQVILRLEHLTSRTFSPERFREVMDLVNEQEDYYRRTRDLVARTVPAPIGVVDSMPATMVPQWHRGTLWARDAAKAFYEEVRERAEAGLGAVPNERVRLMWVGRGMWSEMGFYQKWEESHGAVFVWSMYLALAADGYLRRMQPGQDPLRALASRFITMGDELRMPTWAGPWHVHEAGTHQVDGAVALQDADPFVVRALRAAGYPVLELTADNFNREGEDAAAMETAITTFIEGPARERAEARRVAA